jgi:ATPase subunit of ABC transporter with duplicated ATPase domains
LRFDHVSFAFDEGKKIIMDDVSFSVREKTKITIMGQNGAGKSTLFKLILGELKPNVGKVNLMKGKKIAIARQIIPREQMELTLTEYFATAFEEKDYQLDRKIQQVLDDVNLHADVTKQLRDFSGGQQARILLAHALIQEPDILLLDEPTNNLDRNGIGDLITFLLTYEHTVIVISHDADFLNMFTDGVLYLNVMRHQVEQYRGDYYDVVEQIQTQIEKERQQNVRMEKKIVDAKEKINFFSNK